jgi:flavin-dependent dehydrogenase
VGRSHASRDGSGDHRDVVIAGASFAGLAVAREVPGRAVLVDPEDVGEGQTSACGAPLSVLEALGATGAVQQVHEDLVIHTPGRQVRWRTPEPFCTFDYRACCRMAFAGTGAHVLRAAARGHRGSVAVTSVGAIFGRALVDCTGWRAALARPASPAAAQSRDPATSPDSGCGRAPSRGPRHDHAAASVPCRGDSAALRLPSDPRHERGRFRYFGLEVEAPATFAPGLHFYFWPDVVRDGYAWAFPAGRVTRVGVLSYGGRTRLAAGLVRLRDRLGLPDGPAHGGFLGCGLRPPVVDGVFVVGDAAGQCLPLSGEGIRSSVRAGQVCGGLIRQALDGEISLEAAGARYRAWVMAQRRRYAVLRWSTLVTLTLPAPILGALASLLARPRLLRTFMRHYLALFAPGRPSSHRSGTAGGPAPGAGNRPRCEVCNGGSMD